MRARMKRFRVATFESFSLSLSLERSTLAGLPLLVADEAELVSTITATAA